MIFHSDYKHSPPTDTTPVTSRIIRKSLIRSLLMTLLVVMAFCAALSVFGSPALRIEYSYTGSNEYRNYRYCLYLSLNGWHRIRPYAGVNQCPFLTFVPLKYPF